jgi:hypothetical protein
MKSLILRTPEVNTLSETGIVTVIRPVKVGKYSVVQRKWYGKHPGGGWWGCDVNPYEYGLEPCAGKGFECPFGQIGEVRFVKETWALSHDPYSGYYLHYKAIDNGQKGTKVYAKDMADGFEKYNSGSWLKWRSSSTMPQWASRFNVECVSVEVVKQLCADIWDWKIKYKKV